MNDQDVDPLDRELSAALARLPRQPAPAALRRELEARWTPPVAQPAPRRLGSRRFVAITSTIAIAAAALVAVGTLAASRRADRSDAMFTEAVNDHLRVLYSEHPVEIESGGIHQVKPWFAGRLDFAPSSVFGGDDDFPLQGGAVAYFLDRKAATFEYRYKLHAISLFVFRADGLDWPRVDGERTERGYHALLWRDGDLGYALVSDVNATDLHELSRRIQAAAR